MPKARAAHRAAQRGSYQNDAACVGGGTLSYGAQAWRYLPQDFRMRSTYGAPQGSSLEDWPISYDDLEPFYEKAEYEIGISGDYSGTPFHGPRRRPAAHAAAAAGPRVRDSGAGGQAPGLHPFHIPMARNSVPYNGRGPCMRCRWCCGFACEVDAKNGSQNTVIPHCAQHRELRAAHRVHGEGDPHRRPGPRARRLLLRRPRPLQEQLSDIVVVSGCATESARLLLNSKSRLFPDGLGNRYDQVGRNLQGHHYTGAVGYFDFRHLRRRGPGREHRHQRLQPRHSRTCAAEECWPTSSSACRFT
jgi:choline dehydrogenase-like flavoprotein